MQIDIPDDLMQRVKLRAASTAGGSEVEVIRKGLDALDWQDDQRMVIQEGIDDMNAGRVQDFEAFDRQFRNENGIAPDA